MRLLLDTHVVLWILRGTLRREWPGLHEILAIETDRSIVSVASLWEIAIKTRLGKLDCGMSLENVVTTLERASIPLLDIGTRHAIADIHPEPLTRDPFDRLLLAQCAVEGLRLATADRALASHPLAMTP